jgi:hypothetical protein
MDEYNILNSVCAFFAATEFLIEKQIVTKEHSMVK